MRVLAVVALVAIAISVALGGAPRSSVDPIPAGPLQRPTPSGGARVEPDQHRPTSQTPLPSPTAPVGHSQRPTPKGASVSGTASWYRYVPGGAAAGPALRRALGANWRRRVVVVCRGSVCARVRLSDWCGCPDGRVIDLDLATFETLTGDRAYLGLTQVKIQW